MDSYIMTIDAQSHAGETCQCSNIPVLAHELNQSLMIIYAYVNGCTERLKDNAIDQNDLFNIFDKINKQTQIMKEKIHKMTYKKPG